MIVDILYAMTVVAVFVAVVLLLGALALLWASAHGPGRGSLRQRVAAVSDLAKTAQPQFLKQRPLSKIGWLEKLLWRVPCMTRLDRLLAQSSTALTVAQFIGTSVLAGSVAGATAVWLGLPWWGAALCALAGGGVPLGGELSASASAWR